MLLCPMRSLNVVNRSSPRSRPTWRVGGTLEHPRAQLSFCNCVLPRFPAPSGVTISSVQVGLRRLRSYSSWEVGQNRQVAGHPIDVLGIGIKSSNHLIFRRLEMRRILFCWMTFCNGVDILQVRLSKKVAAGRSTNVRWWEMPWNIAFWCTATHTAYRCPGFFIRNGSIWVPWYLELSCSFAKYLFNLETSVAKLLWSLFHLGLLVQ